MPERRPKHSPPRRVANDSVRTREYLIEQEVERLRAAAAKIGRHGHRDSTMILIAYRHGLRPAELVDLRWEQIDFEQRVLHIARKKRGSPAVHPLARNELAALRKLGDQRTGYVFLSERAGGGPCSTRAFALIVARAGELAGLGMPIHPHMLRHGCGYYLANRGVDTRAIQAYLGHRNIQHTVRYTALSSDRFKNFWPE